MNTKTILALLAGAVIVVGGLVFYFSQNGDNTVTVSDGTKSANVKVGEATETGTTKSACELLTVEIAQGQLGTGAQVADSPSATVGASTDDVAVTNCLYDTGSEDSSDTVDLLARAAKNSDGQSSNISFFESTKNEATDTDGNAIVPESVSGVGDKAYWNPSFRQLVVLVDNGQYWLNLNVSLASAPTAEQRQPLTIQTAQQIIAGI